MRRLHIFVIAILASLGLHLCLVLILYKLVPTTPLTSPTVRPALLDFVEFTDQQPPSLDKQIVRQADVPDTYKADTTNKARFFSAQTQNVLEETRAQATGQTSNRSPEASLDNRPPPPKRDLQLEPLRPPIGDLVYRAQKELKRDEDVPKSIQIPWLSGLNLEKGTSTIGESLPDDIKFGEFTALDTDRYLYYSFYARIEDLIRYRWIKYVRAVLYTYQNTHSRIVQDKWVTRLEIVLDPKGNFQKALIYQGSGLVGLDQAPVQAFREAARIPNPPAEMVKPDGTIRLQYQFTVHFIPQYLASP